MKRYRQKVNLPYIEQVRADLDLPPKQKAFCISDVYKANQDKELLTYMDEKGIKVVFVPVACTDRPKPNQRQIQIPSEFQIFHADEV